MPAAAKLQEPDNNLKGKHNHNWIIWACTGTIIALTLCLPFLAALADLW